VSANGGFIETNVYKRFPLGGIKNWLNPEKNKKKTPDFPRAAALRRGSAQFWVLCVGRLSDDRRIIEAIVNKRFPIWEDGKNRTYYWRFFRPFRSNIKIPA
jgi:hypothetical protein